MSVPHDRGGHRLRAPRSTSTWPVWPISCLLLVVLLFCFGPPTREVIGTHVFMARELDDFNPWSPSALLGAVLFWLWLAGSALVLVLVVIWASRGPGLRLLLAAAGTVLYAAYTAWMYTSLNSGDPLAGFVLVSYPPGQWLIAGLTAASVVAAKPRERVEYRASADSA